MKISNNLKNDSIYLQKKDILYLEKVFNTSFIPKDEEKDYKDNDFILIENKEKVDLIKSRDEILEFKKFLCMTREELEQRMDDAEQLKYIVEKKKAPESEILRYSYEYKSAIDEFLEKGRGSLSFDVPLTLDMLNSYLFYDTNDTYYTASTTMPSTYEVGRIDGKIVDTYDTVLKDFVRNSMITATDIERKNQKRIGRRKKSMFFIYFCRRRGGVQTPAGTIRRGGELRPPRTFVLWNTSTEKT